MYHICACTAAASSQNTVVYNYVFTRHKKHEASVKLHGRAGAGASVDASSQHTVPSCATTFAVVCAAVAAVENARYARTLPIDTITLYNTNLCVGGFMRGNIRGMHALINRVLAHEGIKLKNHSHYENGLQNHPNSCLSSGNPTPVSRDIYGFERKKKAG
jgi:hypothetical protein